MMMFLKRVVCYAIGLLFMAFGVAFSVNSNLGVSPVNSLPYVISRIIHMDLGNCVIMVFSFYIFMQILIMRKEFKWINLTQILFSTAFGKFVDFAKWVVGDFAIPTYAGQLVMLAISILMVAVGVSLYMGVQLVNMPMEGMTHAISEKIVKKLPFHDVKVIVDCISVGVGILLCLVFLGRLEGIREGTVICALLVGKIMKPLKKVIDPAIQKFCFQK
ncbi:YczE/YyaS/YitT family protein [Brotaphodocola sp.]|uniref:YczE/YyaS/YitT family protein n=1 Tax=Brotaphodocola sp. TaxID=3073577 RepID=UPI003D7E39CD